MIIPVPEIKEELLTFLKNIDPENIRDQVILRFAHKISSIDFSNLIDSVISGNNKVFYFNRPEEDFVLLAFDELLSIKIIGDNRFSILRSKISDFTSHSINNFDKVASQDFPLLLGGTKFCSDSKSDEWSDFAANDWFIPRFLFCKNDNEEYFIINLLINGNEKIEKWVNEVLTHLDNLNNIHACADSGEQISSIKAVSNENEMDHWGVLVDDALTKISEGLFKKVVLSRRLVADITGIPLFHTIVSQLRDSYRNCNIFLYKSNNSVLFGATPEQLLKFRNNEIEFDALAGSARRGNTIDEDNKIAQNLLTDKKNGNEHNQVIEFIRDVSLNYVQNFRQSGTGIKKFSNIQHIYTPIKGILKSRDQIYDLVEDIFPTPAICGSPKTAALQYIIEHEKFDRGMFSGIIGFINSNEMDLSVAIRSALFTHNKLFVYAGCGIVNGSDPRSEFEETEIKMRPILSLFKNED